MSVIWVEFLRICRNIINTLYCRSVTAMYSASQGNSSCGDYLLDKEGMNTEVETCESRVSLLGQGTPCSQGTATGGGGGGGGGGPLI